MNFRDKFEHETHHLPVPDTDIATIITTARTRTRRRRVAVSTVAVATLIVATGVGIQQLSATRHANTFAIPPAPEPSSATSAWTVPESEVPVSVDAASDTAASEELVLPNAIPAQVVPANIAWSVVSADSPEALAYRFDSTQRYALATVPGPAAEDPGKTVLYEQVNGEWNELPFEDPPGIDPFISGDTVYGIGRAPATPGGPPGSFGTFDIASAKWHLHELPAEIGLYESDAIAMEFWVTSVPVDDGLIVYPMSQLLVRSVKYQEFVDDAQVGPFIDGDAIVTFSGCDNDAYYDALTSDSETVPSEEQQLELARKYCSDENTAEPSEFGLSPADLDALGRLWTGDTNTAVWKVTADSMVPFDVPGVTPGDPFGYMSLTGERGLSVSTYDPQTTTLYTIGHDGSLTQVFGDLSDVTTDFYLASVAPPDGSLVVGGLDRYLLSGRPDKPTQVTDVQNVIVNSEMINPSVSVEPVGVAGPLSVARASYNYDRPGTLTEPASVSDSGYTLKMLPGTMGYNIIDDATGESVQFGYTLSTESGKPQLMRYPDMSVSSYGAATPTTIADSAVEPEPELLATFDIDWKTVPGLNSGWGDVLLTTTDGVNVAVSDLESIVRQDSTVADEDEVGAGQAEVKDGRVLVPVYVYSGSDYSADDYSEREFLLIGTPL